MFFLSPQDHGGKTLRPAADPEERPDTTPKVYQPGSSQWSEDFDGIVGGKAQSGAESDAQQAGKARIGVELHVNGGASMAVIQQHSLSETPETPVPASLAPDRTLDRISDLGKSSITGAAAGVGVAAAVASTLGFALATPGAIAGAVVGAIVTAYFMNRNVQAPGVARKSGFEGQLNKSGQ
jgi:hypothetical protein